MYVNGEEIKMPKVWKWIWIGYLVINVYLMLHGWRLWDGLNF
ncbi:hypothetical protein LCGC14_0475580 [marine sediment metagenome]|uniref:Uncharacterized protein n=1 Tax=marine sediment metagenome TaxID=412755 RepID=A0A0F9SB10_9ZZZZ